MSNAVTSPEAVGMSMERLERIRPAMQRYVDDGRFPGMSTMIARRGQVVHFEQVGWADREAERPLAADTIYRIYSMTKPIVCTALMTLYEEGAFQLLDPVSKYMPGFSNQRVMNGDGSMIEPSRPINVRDLMLHTSGLTYDFLEDSPVGELYRQARLGNDAERSLEAMIGELARMPLAIQPGAAWYYSLGIDVAAHLIEVLSGQPLADILRARIFEPLGMTDTSFFVPPAKRARISAMYGLPDLFGPGAKYNDLVEAGRRGFNQRIDVSTTNPADSERTFARGGHGLFSTAPDYMRFAQMLLNGGELDGARVLSRKTTELMHTNHLPAALLPYMASGEPASGYGFGLGSRVLMNVAASAMPGSVGEFGWGGAARTYYWVDPHEQLIGLMMTQSMINQDTPDVTFRALAYQAIVD